MAFFRGPLVEDGLSFVVEGSMDDLVVVVGTPEKSGVCWKSM